MRAKYRMLCASALLVMLMTTGAAADVPSLMNYQGRLAAHDGAPVNDTVRIQFEFYNHPTAGDMLFSEEQQVTVTDGLFRVIIGSESGGIPIDALREAEVYLALVVEGDSLEPRERIVSVAYAMVAAEAGYAHEANHASDADLLDGLDSSEFLRSGTSNMTIGRLTAEDGIHALRDASGGADSAAVLAENTNAEGIAFAGQVTSADSCSVFVNKGSGDIIRGFTGATGGDLVFQVENNGRVRCKELEITGGADLAEPFPVADARLILPGMVMVIDAEHPGQLRVADRAYDRTVAGIVSGAGGVSPGVTMKQEGTGADGELPVALTGRVYCWCDASNGAIAPGDLLTTSDTPGHAMKATDRAKAQGAILGKAMEPLEEGKKGLILVLVTLQ